MKLLIKAGLILSFLSLHICGHAESPEEEEYEAPFHALSLITANSYITNYVRDNKNALILVPTFGINYDYFIRTNWGIGVHTDIIVQQYKIERHDNQAEVIRDNPVAVCGMLSYKFLPRFKLTGGYGVELEKNENINLFRLGIEYGIPLRDKWELGFTFEYDHKIKAYSSFMTGIIFTKIFPGEKGHKTLPGE